MAEMKISKSIWRSTDGEQNAEQNGEQMNFL